MWRFVGRKPKPKKSSWVFKLEHPFEVRKREAERLIQKHPNRVPLIIEKSNHADLQDMDNKKFIIPEDMSVGQLLFLIRKRIHLDASQSIFLFINNNIIPNTSDNVGHLYKHHKDDDKFLYVTYSPENTFG